MSYIDTDTFSLAAHTTVFVFAIGTITFTVTFLLFFNACDVVIA